MKTVYSKAFSLCVFFVVMLMIIGIVAAEDSAGSSVSTGSDGISSENVGPSPVMDFGIDCYRGVYAVAQTGYYIMDITNVYLTTGVVDQVVVFFYDHSINADKVVCDFGDGTYGSYSPHIETNYSFAGDDCDFHSFMGTLHTYSPGSYPVEFTAFNRSETNTKANTLVINSDGSYELLPAGTGLASVPITSDAPAVEENISIKTTTPTTTGNNTGY